SACSRAECRHLPGRPWSPWRRGRRTRRASVCNATARSGSRRNRRAPAAPKRELVPRPCSSVPLEIERSSNYFRAMPTSDSTLSPSHLKAVIVRRDRFDRGVRHVLEEGMERGAFGSGDAKLLAFAIFGAVNWIPRWFDPNGAASSQEIAERFADYLIAGLRRT